MTEQSISHGQATSSTIRAWGVVVAGGSGARYGGLKQLEALRGRRVLDWSIASLDELCGGVVVVVPPSVVSGLDVGPRVTVVAGGTTRSASVRAGLAAVPAEATHVLVHDAARPLATPELSQRVVAALAEGASGAVPVVAVADSLRTVEGEPVDRSRFVAVQTPQGFEIEALRRAHQGDDVASDDASLVDRLGLEVVHVEGETTNFKITQPHDLQVAEVLLHEH